MLGGISLGNYLGGRVADRRYGRATLACQFFLAAGGSLSVLVLNQWMGRWQMLAGVSWPVRIFVHVALAFALASVLLGTISPVVTKRALSCGRAVGRTARGPRREALQARS